MTDAKKRLLARRVQEVCREDILLRYDNCEYYDFELDEVEDILNGLSIEDKVEVLKLIR
jgi:hypothetical protein